MMMIFYIFLLPPPPPLSGGGPKLKRNSTFSAPHLNGNLKHVVSGPFAFREHVIAGPVEIEHPPVERLVVGVAPRRARGRARLLRARPEPFFASAAKEIASFKILGKL